jgi:hypothetical protein
MTFRIWQEDGDGDGGGADTVVEEKELPPVEEYVGNEEVNPMQRPLKDSFVREGRSHKEIDDIIKNSGGGLFLNDDEIKAQKAEKKDKEKEDVDEKKKDGEDTDKKTDDETKSKDKEDGDKKKSDDEPDLTKEEKAELEKKDKEDIEHFFKTTGLDQDKFDALPEETQDLLFAKVFPPEDETKDEEKDKLTKEHQELKDNMAAITGDHLIAARLKEKETGNKYVADPKDILTQKVLDRVDELLSDKKVTEAKDLLHKEVEKAIKVERSVQDQVYQNEKDSQEVWKILRKAGDIDKRLKIDEKSYKKFNEHGEKHKEWKDFNKKDGMNDFINFLVDKGLGFAQVKKLGTEGAYTLFAKDRGWDKETTKRIFKQGAKSVLDKLKNPTKAGTLKDQAKKPMTSMLKKGSTGVDVESLTKGLAEGKAEAKQQYFNLFRAYHGDTKMTNILLGIKAKAENLREEMNKKE